MNRHVALVIITVGSIFTSHSLSAATLPFIAVASGTASVDFDFFGSITVSSLLGADTQTFSLSDTFISESVSGTSTGSVTLGGGGDSVSFDSGSEFGAVFQQNTTTDTLSFYGGAVSLTLGVTPIDATLTLLDAATRSLSASGPNQYVIGAGDLPDMRLAYNILVNASGSGGGQTFSEDELVSDVEFLNSVDFGGMLTTTSSGALSSLEFMVADLLSTSEIISETVEGVTITLDGTITLQNLSASATVIPVPAAVWLMGSGLLGLIGIARKKKIA